VNKKLLQSIVKRAHLIIEKHGLPYDDIVVSSQTGGSFTPSRTGGTLRQHQTTVHVRFTPPLERRSGGGYLGAIWNALRVDGTAYAETEEKAADRALAMLDENLARDIAKLNDTHRAILFRK